MTDKFVHAVGLTLASALAAIALLHAYWALGGRWGLAAALGGPEKSLPPAWLIWFVTVLILGAAFVVLGRSGVVGSFLPGWLFALGCWALAAALAIVAILNLLAKTKPEQFLFGPLAALLAAAAVVVALRKP